MQSEDAVCYADYCDIFRCDGYVDNMQKIVEEQTQTKWRKFDIFPLLYKFSKDLLKDLGLSLDDSGVLHKEQGSDSKKALVQTPSRKLLNDIEKSRKLERSGEFIVGSDDPDVADILRDPFGFEPMPSNVKTSFTQWLKRQKFIHQNINRQQQRGPTKPSKDDHFQAEAEELQILRKTTRNRVIKSNVVTSEQEEEEEQLGILDGFKTLADTLQDILHGTNNTQVQDEDNGDDARVEVTTSNTQEKCDPLEMEERQIKCNVSTK